MISLRVMHFVFKYYVSKLMVWGLIVLTLLIQGGVRFYDLEKHADLILEHSSGSLSSIRTP